jgi:hypothetical protein
MLFKILFIIGLCSGLQYVYGFKNNRFLYKTVIYNHNINNYGSEFDMEMCDEERKLHKEIRTEEEREQYIKDVIELQKYQTMYKLLKYLLDNDLNTNEKIYLLNIFKKEIKHRKF